MGWIKEIKNQKQRRKYSQNGEEYVLKYIFDHIGTTNKRLVDIGAWDGKHLSNTRLFIEQGWQGILIDAKDFPGVYKSFITKENIIETLQINGCVQAPDLLSIDIDGNDYWVLNEVLQHYSPRVIVSEFNSEHPLSESKTIEYDPAFTFDNFSDYYGYTYGAGLNLAAEFGYTIIYQQSNLNLFYLRNDLVTERPDFPVNVYRHWNGVSNKKWVTIEHMKPDNLNQKGFEGDTFIGPELKKLAAAYKVDCIVETGTYYGYSTLKLHDIVPNVVTIESDHEPQKAASALFEGKNIWTILAHSQNCLGEVIDNMKKKGAKSFMFFLDAHWEDHCPLMDELKHIAEAGIKPVIAIHDFRVPGKDFGFDTYQGQPYEFTWIESQLQAIYGDKLAYHYNEEADGHKRGIIYIYPKKAKPGRKPSTDSKKKHK